MLWWSRWYPPKSVLKHQFMTGDTDEPPFRKRSGGNRNAPNIGLATLPHKRGVPRLGHSPCPLRTADARWGQLDVHMDGAHHLLVVCGVQSADLPLLFPIKLPQTPHWSTGKCTLMDPAGNRGTPIALKNTSVSKLLVMAAALPAGALVVI